MTHKKMNPPQPVAGSRRICAGTAQTKNSKWAPFAHDVLKRQRAGIQPNVYLFAGRRAWDRAEQRLRTHGEGSVLLLPHGENPDARRWPGLDSLVLIPGDEDGEIIRRLIIRLLLSGCRCVVTVRPGHGPIAHYADERDALGVAA